MKRIFQLFFLPWLASLPARSQSMVEFQSGTTIEVTSGADICADNIVINGTYSGNGTKCDGPLPVELVAITAHAVERDIILGWTTAAETNNYGFEIERRSLPISSYTAKGIKKWDRVGFVEGSGTANSPKKYSFTDINPSTGKYSYRLKQIDRDGKFKYSQEAEVEVGSVPKVFSLSQNYPNPFNPTTVIRYGLPEQSRVKLEVFNMLGQKVVELVDQKQEAHFYEVQWKANVASGIYFYHLQVVSLKDPHRSLIQTKKMILMK